MLRMTEASVLGDVCPPQRAEEGRVLTQRTWGLFGKRVLSLLFQTVKISTSKDIPRSSLHAGNA